MVILSVCVYLFLYNASAAVFHMQGMGATSFGPTINYATDFKKYTTCESGLKICLHYGLCFYPFKENQVMKVAGLGGSASENAAQPPSPDSCCDFYLIPTFCTGIESAFNKIIYVCNKKKAVSVLVLFMLLISLGGMGDGGVGLVQDWGAER